MNALVGTLVLILLALLGARFSFSTSSVPAGPRLLFRTGTHFLFIGFLLGPHALGLLTLEAVEQLFPLLALGLGWVGFLFGMQLDRENLRQFPRAFYVFAFGQAILTFVIFAALGWVAFFVIGIQGEAAHLLVLGAAAVASVTTPAGIALVSTTFMAKGEVRRLLFFVGSLDALVGIMALQVIYSFYYAPDLLLGLGDVATPAWTVVALGLGVVLGILFLWITRRKAGPEEMVLFLMGIAALGSGAALQLHLSPLFVAVVLGAVVANLSPERQRIFAVLERWEKPVYLVFLLLAGAYLQFATPWVVALAMGYAVFRGLGKVVGSAVMLRVVRLPFATPNRVGYGLIPQGGIALAMAVSGMLTYSGLQVSGVDAVELLFAVLVLGVVASELSGPFFTTRVLRRAGEISPAVERALEEGDEEGAQEEAIRHDASSGTPPAEEAGE